MKSTIVALAVVHGLEHMLHKVTSEHYNYLVFTSVGFADNNNKNNNNKNAADTAKGTWFPALCHLFAPLVSTMLLRTEVRSLLLRDGHGDNWRGAALLEKSEWTFCPGMSPKPSAVFVTAAQRLCTDL